MTGLPLVTVGITCFNASETIERALASALAQDWPSIEVVVADDCSTDGSAEIVNRRIAGLANVRLLRHELNRGPGAARNTILQAAAGEFVAFFDDDDESMPNRISAQMRRLLAYEGETGARLVACYASGERRYPNGYTMPLQAIGSIPGEEPAGNLVADYLLFFRRVPGRFYGSGVPSCALLARTSTFAAVGGFDSTLRRVEDVDLAIRLAFADAHFIGTAEKVFVQHATDAPDKSPAANLIAAERLAEKNKAYLAGVRRYYYARHWPRLRYWHFMRDYPRMVLELVGLLLHNPIAVASHFLATGPRRLLHERAMRRRRNGSTSFAS